MNFSNEQINRFLETMSNISTGVKYLGTGDAGTTMGAVEYHAVETRAGLDNVAEALREVAAALRERA